MKVIHVVRKPLSESPVAANVLKHGTGALNIDATRIGTTKDIPASITRTSTQVYSGAVDGSLRRQTGEGSGFNPNIGRWPANAILQHLPGCRQEGSEQWGCESGCPVLVMDEELGPRRSGAMDSMAKGGQWSTLGKQYRRRVVNPASEGNASRFFKQIGGEPCE